MIDPRDEARHRHLESEAQHERDQAERDERRVPVGEQHGDREEHGDQTDDETEDAFQVEARDAIGHAADQEDLDALAKARIAKISVAARK
jgi:hypothetical protein